MSLTNWKNLPDTSTPVNKTNLNNINSDLVNVGTSVDDTYNVNFLKGKNLFNKATALSGVAIKRSNGEETSLSNYTSSAFIQVQPSTQYYLGISYSSTDYGVCYYTNTGTFISGERLDNRFTTPSNCYYIRFSFQPANYDINTIQLEKGSVATTYEAYITPTINVDGEDIYSKSKVLWNNPNPNAEFGSQNITLSSSDYDYLEVLYTAQGSNDQYIKSTGKIPKGKDIKIDDVYIQHSNTNAIRIYSRLLSYTNATTFSVNSARYASSFTSSEVNNNFAIPYKIIGYKE